MIRVLSLGAGVQSSTLALMAERGVIEKVDCAIFADTQSEPQSVYAWLSWLESQLSYPVYRVTKGNLGEDEMRLRVSKKSGKTYMKNSIPAFVLKPDGKAGLLGRKCTADYKIAPIQRKIKELCGIKRSSGKPIAQVLVGISWDEVHRMKDSRVPYIVNTWPLIDKKITREACILWMKENGYPEPPRSSCVFCPFHSDSEWSRLKILEPKEFDRVVAFEKSLQEANKKQNTMVGIPFLHSSCKPIAEVDFSKKKRGYAQLDMFGNECEGLCGV